VAHVFRGLFASRAGGGGRLGAGPEIPARPDNPGQMEHLPVCSLFHFRALERRPTEPTGRQHFFRRLHAGGHWLSLSHGPGDRICASLGKKPGESAAIGHHVLQLRQLGCAVGAIGLRPGGLGHPRFVLSTMNVSTFTLGLLLAHGQEGASWGKALGAMLRQPSIHAIVLAMLVRWFDAEPWNSVPWLWSALTPLSDALPGVALVTLGVQLSQTRPPWPDRALWAALVIRLCLAPLIGFGLCLLFRFDFQTTAILLAVVAAPTAINTALLAHEFKADARFATATVYYSTILGLFTTAGLLAWMKALGWF
jgi:hypothetical protein